MILFFNKFNECVCIDLLIAMYRFDFVKLLLLLFKKGVNNYVNDNVQLTDNQTDLQLRPPT